MPDETADLAADCTATGALFVVLVVGAEHAAVSAARVKI